MCTRTHTRTRDTHHNAVHINTEHFCDGTLHTARELRRGIDHHRIALAWSRACEHTARTPFRTDTYSARRAQSVAPGKSAAARACARIPPLRHRPRSPARAASFPPPRGQRHLADRSSQTLLSPLPTPPPPQPRAVADLRTPHSCSVPLVQRGADVPAKKLCSSYTTRTRDAARAASLRERASTTAIAWPKNCTSPEQGVHIIAGTPGERSQYLRREAALRRVRNAQCECRRCCGRGCPRR